MLNVHYLPQFVAEEDLAGSTVVMIDLLRASSTICYALAAGAREVRPFLHIDDVLRCAEGQDRGSLVLGGERGGERIEGFDLGNSPAEYTAEVVFGRQVLFTTTNGTVALNHARIADRIVVGCMANLAALVKSIKEDDQINILCAGTNGHVTREDNLAAGAICHRLLKKGRQRKTNDMADSVLREWQELLTTARALDRTPSEQLAEELKTTPGGKNLIAIGQDDDLELCAQIDKIDLVPEYNSKTGAIRSL